MEPGVIPYTLEDRRVHLAKKRFVGAPRMVGARIHLGSHELQVQRKMSIFV
jgi:hypothetical protein